ncbi:hypothetical protein AB0N89_25400 [Amycolatopsis sp. NPDC089917]|uniref:hypothetical protein n=1 Tax=Amycolatopsis sp. NPDC089917 TaxID=3155187 RepID=UPI00343557E0
MRRLGMRVAVCSYPGSCANPGDLAALRSWARTVLTARSSAKEPAVDEVVLVLDELATDALVNGGVCRAASLSFTADGVRAEVTANRRSVAVSATRRWSLIPVLASRWGRRTGAAGVRMWATIARTTVAAPA